MKDMDYELIIIGGGPGGAAAGVYAARKRLKTLLIAEEIGGQSIVSQDIQNWIGIIQMTGLEMAEKLEEHLKAYAEDVLELKIGDEANAVTKDKDGFRVATDGGEFFTAQAVIITAGAHRRKLDIPGAQEFDGKGVVYCASCDAPLFKDKAVAVIGGGNAGLETAEQLLAYASKITILEFGEEYKGDRITRDRVFQSDKVTPLTNVEAKEIKGEQFVSGLVFKDRKSGETTELAVEGIFVEIGSIPSTEMLKDLLELDRGGHIVIDHKTSRTSVTGIWAAGDITDQPYKQNNISMGDAVKALEDAYVWLKQRDSK